MRVYILLCCALLLVSSDIKAGSDSPSSLAIDELRLAVADEIRAAWRNNPATRGVKLKSLILVHRSGNDYTGVATSDDAGEEEKHMVEVTYDGKNFVWRSSNPARC